MKIHDLILSGKELDLWVKDFLDKRERKRKRREYVKQAINAIKNESNRS